jgi:CDP-diacylglycerol--glycerol-3-phosphate 3-phosphatidyltransferase
MSIKKRVLNLPNMLTGGRLFLAVIFFGLLALCRRMPVAQGAEAGSITQRTVLLDIAAAIFIVAAVTDILDGMLARRWNLTTDFGRIADPFVDKIIILGAFIFFLPMDAFVRPWMVVVILAREILVSGIRSFAESKGIAFPAGLWGKIKMVSQSVTVVAVPIYLAHYRPDIWILWLLKPILWICLGWAVACTVISGLVYIPRAIEAIRAGEGRASPG